MKKIIVCLFLSTLLCGCSMDSLVPHSLPDSIKDMQDCYLEDSSLFIHNFVDMSVTDTFYLMQVFEQIDIASEALENNEFIITDFNGKMYSISMTYDKNNITSFSIREES